MINMLDEKIAAIKRNENKIVVGEMGEGWGFVTLSQETVAGTVKNGVKFVKNGKNLILTKEELINEFRIGLQKGYFTKEELLDGL